MTKPALIKLTPDDQVTNMLIIPDAQNAPGHPTKHLEALGNWIMERKPDWIHNLGDWNDNKAAGKYESDAKKGLEERDVKADLEHAKLCNDILYGRMTKFNSKARRDKRYTPKQTKTLGNHEYRLNRLCENHPWLRSLIFDDSNFNEKKYGIEEYPFLQIIKIAGVYFSHFFPQAADGNVKQTRNGQANAKLQVQRLANSAIAGHQQGLSIHMQTTPERRLRGIIAGSFYLHDEVYMGPSGNNYWRGVLYLKNMKNGDFDLEEVSMEALLRDYL